MATAAQIARSKRPVKFMTRTNRRCVLCGRKSPIRDFGLCRICFREKANKGEIPGVHKASW